MYTLREIAGKLNLNKVTIFKHYKQLQKNNKELMGKHTTVKKNRILLDKRAYSELVSTFKYLHLNDNKNININGKSTVIKLLKSELEDKNNRINKLDDQVTNLNEELKHQQELQLNEQRRNKELNQSLTESLISNKNQTGKHGFFYKLKRFFK